MNFYEHESLLLVSLQEKKNKVRGEKRKREWKNVENKREIKWETVRKLERKLMERIQIQFLCCFLFDRCYTNVFYFGVHLLTETFIFPLVALGIFVLRIFCYIAISVILVDIICYVFLRHLAARHCTSHFFILST